MSIVHGNRNSVKYGHRAHVSATADTVRQQRIAEALSALRDCVYVIAFEDDVVKIGWTSNLRQRLVNLHVGRSDLGARLLLVKPGSLTDEHALHERFAAHTARGREYFHRHPDLMAWVNEERAAMSLPTV